MVVTQFFLTSVMSIQCHFSVAIYHSAAISNKGEVIFINRSSVQSPESEIKSVCLPDGEKAVSVACCSDSIVALSSNGRVFLSAVQSESSVQNFSTVSELSGQEIVWVSGTCIHFLAVSREGRVFGRGLNKYAGSSLSFLRHMKVKTSHAVSIIAVSSSSAATKTKMFTHQQKQRSLSHLHSVLQANV